MADRFEELMEDYDPDKLRDAIKNTTRSKVINPDYPRRPYDDISIQTIQAILLRVAEILRTDIDFSPIVTSTDSNNSKRKRRPKGFAKKF